MQSSKRSFWVRWKWAIITIIVLFVVYLFSEHKIHIMRRFSLVEILLILILLMCVFMHQGHKHKKDGEHQQEHHDNDSNEEE